MKSRICILTCFLTLILSLTAFANIYESSEIQPIAKGVTLNELTFFNEDGWTFLNMLEIDLNEKSINISPLTSPNGINNFTSLQNMITEPNTIAALSGGYFKKKTAVANTGHSLGFLGENSRIITSSAHENDSSNTLSTFILNNNNDVIYSYLKDTITIKSPKNGNTFEVCSINKYMSGNGIAIYTSDWSDLSIGNTDEKIFVEVVVVENTVAEIRKFRSPTPIPENGYIVLAYGTDAIMYILNNFQVGDKIEYSIDINLDLESMKFAISGGTMLIKNGIIPTFTYKAWEKSEMVAIGTNQKEDKLYLISCTAKQNNSTGIEKRDFAQLLTKYGVHNAVCLNSGDFATMLVKEPEEKNITAISSDFENKENISNGIGIINNTEPSGKIKKLLVDLSDEYIFKNNAVTFVLSGYDTNYHALDIDTNLLKVSFDNNNAKYEDGKIIGLKEGVTEITFEYMGKKTKKKLHILGEVYELEISPKNCDILITDTINFKLLATDKDGYSSIIDNSTINWKIETGNGTIKDGVFTPSKHETVIISANIDNITVFSTINVNKEITKVFDDYEDNKGIFSSYPSSIVSGEAHQNDVIKLDGKYSMQLTYDFSNNSQAVRATYFDYKTPLKLTNNITEIGVWIYSPEMSKNSVKSQYKDASGTTCSEILANEMDWVGWKYLTYPSYDEVRSIVSIYVAQNNKAITDKNFICIDNFTVKYLGNDSENIIAPNDIMVKDAYQKEQTNAYCITFMDTIQQTHLSNINNNTNILFTYQQLPQLLTKELNIKNKTVSNYSVTDMASFRIITVDNSNKGIRQTNYKQWEKLIKDIKVNKNILIVLSNPLNKFTDTLEKDLLINLLQEKIKTSNKICWIVQYGNTTNVENIDGIKILTVQKSINQNTTNCKYINIYSSYKDISFEIKEY